MWRKVEVVGSETLGEELDDNLDRGLDIDAETMHQRFWQTFHILNRQKIIITRY